jgi:hypothetical protein
MAVFCSNISNSSIDLELVRISAQLSVVPGKTTVLGACLRVRALGCSQGVDLIRSNLKVLLELKVSEAVIGNSVAAFITFGFNSSSSTAAALAVGGAAASFSAFFPCFSRCLLRLLTISSLAVMIKTAGASDCLTFGLGHFLACFWVIVEFLGHGPSGLRWLSGLHVEAQLRAGDTRFCA